MQLARREAMAKTILIHISGMTHYKHLGTSMPTKNEQSKMYSLNFESTPDHKHNLEQNKNGINAIFNLTQVDQQISLKISMNLQKDDLDLSRKI